MSELSSSSAPPPQNCSATSVVETSKAVVARDSNKFRCGSIRQSTAGNAAVSDSREKSVILIPINTQQNPALYGFNNNVYGRGYYLDKKSLEYSEGRRQGEKNKKQKNNDSDRRKSKNNVSKRLEEGVSRVRKGCKRLFNGKASRRRLRL